MVSSTILFQVKLGSWEHPKNVKSNALIQKFQEVINSESGFVYYYSQGASWYFFTVRYHRSPVRRFRISQYYVAARLVIITITDSG
jgi:hypothetical protein